MHLGANRADMSVLSYRLYQDELFRFVRRTYPNAVDLCVAILAGFSALYGGPPITQAQLTVLQEHFGGWFALSPQIRQLVSDLTENKSGFRRVEPG